LTAQVAKFKGKSQKMIIRKRGPAFVASPFVADPQGMKTMLLMSTNSNQLESHLKDHLGEK
jgi:hypothetical protein